MSSSVTCTRLTLFTLAAVTVQIIGLSFFIFGFFPVKPALSGESGSESFRVPTCYSIRNETERDLPPHELKSLYQELSGIHPLFDRLILMVIDGLPAEFVLGKDARPPNKVMMEAMPYTQSLLANGIAKGYHAKASPPTVTMPRLKAIVSGAIGGFLDVAFNFNTQALLEDNILGQFFKIGWKMVMHGDETWLKLFPGLFTRHDGVSSFFVKDTVQVDKNVSRHLGYEFSKNDWNLLILHYLGLDHVGHIGGRNSPLMATKLMEMDEVVKMIYMSAVMNPEDKNRTLLVVVSDHGMTDNGNHGGSSYEETDSLLLLIGLENHVNDFASVISNNVNQVDIAPTLALLFGVPIPKNNVGVVIAGMVDSLKDTQQLRALQLNSWQLLRLLQAQVPGFPCGSSPCDDFSGDHECNSNGSMEKFCCLYLHAAGLYDSSISKVVSSNLSRFYSREDNSRIIAAYYEFLMNANRWLSHKATDKPVKVIAFGVGAMLLSCVIYFTVFYSLFQETYFGEKQLSFHVNGILTWHLDEGFSVALIIILVVSMGSSSMVEEEQYIWHYLISTLNMLLLRKRMQFFPTLSSGHKRLGLKISSIFILLISGRILRGWHQGGVNWTYLPDISKWLEQSGTDLQLIQLASGLLTIILSLFSLFLLGRRTKIVLVVGLNFLMSGLLVLHHIRKYQNNASLSSNSVATSLAQIIYASLGLTTVGTVIAVPWIMPIQISKACSRNASAISSPVEVKSKSQFEDLRNVLYIIGWTYVGSWCLLQLLLQQPINSAVILLILIQIFASVLFSSSSMLQPKHWVEVAMLYYLGMAGHFALGNSNSLATIDVAGAFIGISNYSTLFSGILMFIITYASPMLLLLSMVMYISITNQDIAASPRNVDSGQVLKTILGFPCLVPLCVNSILLIAYTVVLLLMRNHLFVWSVFSPKYLYACATTVCILIGVLIVATTVTYAHMVLSLRKNMLAKSINDKR